MWARARSVYNDRFESTPTHQHNVRNTKRIPRIPRIPRILLSETENPLIPPHSVWLDRPPPPPPLPRLLCSLLLLVGSVLFCLLSSSFCLCFWFSFAGSPSSLLPTPDSRCSLLYQTPDTLKRSVLRDSERVCVTANLCALPLSAMALLSQGAEAVSS